MLFLSSEKNESEKRIVVSNCYFTLAKIAEMWDITKFLLCFFCGAKRKRPSLSDKLGLMKRTLLLSLGSHVTMASLLVILSNFNTTYFSTYRLRKCLDKFYDAWILVGCSDAFHMLLNFACKCVACLRLVLWS